MPLSRVVKERGEVGLRARRSSANPISINDPEASFETRYGGANEPGPSKNIFSPMSAEGPRLLHSRHEMLEFQRNEENSVGEQEESQLDARYLDEVVSPCSEDSDEPERIELTRSHSTSYSNGSGNKLFPQRSRRAEPDMENPLDNSPYSQVRAAVSATDDLSLSINTPRMWTLSLLFAILGSATNLFFSLRYPSVTITPVIALLLVHPLGLLWDRLFKRSNDPREQFENGNLTYRARGTLPANDPTTPLHGTRNGYFETPENPSNKLHSFRLWLAQGRWNEKEHACVYISSNVSFGFAFATDVRISTPLVTHV